MAGKICIYVRDPQHPADLYDTNRNHYFAISIHEIGSNGPLYWKGVNYNWVWLPFQGEWGKVAGEYEVPAGEYLIKGYAWCFNVVTHIAWVQVNDNETVSVNLVPTSVPYCLHAATIGVVLGTAIVEGKDVPIAKIAPAEVAAFEKAAEALAIKLPKEVGVPLMAIEELRNLFSKTPPKG
ncbi:MAG: hypothetical protein ACE14V_13285 [bacterium]